MLVTQVIPAVIQQSVAKAQHINLCRIILNRNSDLQKARDSLHRDHGLALDVAANNVAQRNPDIIEVIIDQSWNLV